MQFLFNSNNNWLRRGIVILTLLVVILIVLVPSHSVSALRSSRHDEPRDCYVHSCSGESNCTSFHFPEVKPSYVRRCPDKSSGCWHIGGQPVSSHSPRHIRGCWTGHHSTLGSCFDVTFTEWTDDMRVVNVTGVKCVCENNLCNGDVEALSSHGEKRPSYPIEIFTSALFTYYYAFLFTPHWINVWQ